MKPILTHLIPCLLPMFVSSVANAAEPVCKVSLEARPAFGSLVQAGLKFLNPEPQSDASRRQISPKLPMGLSADVATVTLQVHGTSLELSHCDVIQVSIRGEDLIPPGKYYPAQPPVTDSTLIGGITFGSNGLGSEDVRKLFLAVASAFKLEKDKVDAWFDHQIWEVTESPGITISQNFPDFSVEYSIVPERTGDVRIPRLRNVKPARTGNAKVTFVSILRIYWNDWNDTPTAEPAATGQPAADPTQKTKWPPQPPIPPSMIRPR